MRNALFLYLLLFCPALACARDYPMLHYTQENGMPGDCIYKIFRDTDGMIWLGTSKGVSRYNGLHFENFSMKDGLPDNEIFDFTKDHEGRLWMATYNGKPGFYKDGIFHNEQNTPFLRLGGILGFIKVITLEQDSSLTFLLNDPAKFLVVRKNKVSVKRLPQYIVDKYKTSPFAIYKKNRSAYVVVYARTRIEFDTSGKVLSEQPNTNTSWTKSGLYYCCEDKLYNKEGHYLQNLPDIFINDNQLINFYHYAGHSFCCTYNGLWIDQERILAGHKISSVLCDRNGDYWISTLDDGMYKLPAHFHNGLFLPGSYTKPVTNTAWYNGDLFFGTTDMSVYRLRDTSVRLLFQLDEQSRKLVSIMDYCLFSYAKGNYLVSTSKVIRYGEGQKPRISSMKTHNGPREILQGAGSRLYNRHINYISSVRTPENLLDWDMEAPLSAEDDNRKIIAYDVTNRKYAIAMDRDSNTWFSAANGIYRVRGTKALRQPQFAALTFRDMAFCRQYLAGIDLLGRLIMIRNYDRPDLIADPPLPGDCIWDKLYRLTDSSLLVTTNDYYRVITFANTGAVPGYRVEVIEYPFAPQLAEKVFSNDTDCYFLRKGNITRIPVRDLIQPPALPGLRFISASMDHKKIPADILIRLDYNSSRALSLVYHTLSFNTDLLSYEYSINSTGEPSNWVKSNGTNIDLFNMAAGDYTVSIRARTFGGRYSSVQSLRLVIAAPFWQRWWFLLVLLALAGGVVLLAVRVYLQRRLLLKEKENKFLRAEFTALNALMNPHFVFNSLNSVQSLINKEDLEAANLYVRTISDLLRQNMHNISRELIPLKKEMELIDNYLKLEKLRFKERLQYTISVDEEVEEEFLLVPPLLVQPLVENAIKYTLAFSEIDTGHIHIAIYCRDQQVIIDVTDNGKGLNAAKTRKAPGHESTALGNIHKRLEQLSLIHGKNYRLEITELSTGDNKIGGTRARISIEL